MKSLIMALGLFGTATAAELYVNNNQDFGPGSLRCALESAQVSDDIIFDSQMKGTILLEKPLPMIVNDLTIHGPTNGITISGCGKYPVFFVFKGNVVIENVNIERGVSFGGFGGESCGGNGGGAMGAGGALFVNTGASVHFSNGSFTQNEAKGGYGGNFIKGNSISCGGGGGGGLCSGHGGKGGMNNGTGNGGGGGGGWAASGMDGLLDGGLGGGKGGSGGTGSKLLGKDGYHGSHGDLFKGAGGGHGGFGGGGGGGGGNSTLGLGGFGGNGGFGAGGGGGGKGALGGRGGFGGGHGGDNNGAGGGGAAFGGAIFVRTGGSLVLDKVRFKGNLATPGMGGAGAAPGMAEGHDIYVMEGAYCEVISALSNYDCN